MTTLATDLPNVRMLDDEHVSLVRLAAIIAVGDEPAVRIAVARAATNTRPQWVEEVILQSYLFAGFPRALNAAREWRKVSGRPAPAADDGERIEDIGEWAARGEATCAVVYGPFYERLRRNIRALHPALDSWMIVEGYGKVLSRPGLDLPRRELCIVAACVASGQERQLHSHLHGALNVGVPAPVVRESLDALQGVVAEDRLNAARLLFERVIGK